MGPKKKPSTAPKQAPKPKPQPKVARAPAKGRRRQPSTEADPADAILFDHVSRQVARFFNVPLKELQAPERGAIGMQFLRKIQSQVMAEFGWANAEEGSKDTKLDIARLARSVGKDKSSVSEHLKQMDEWVARDEDVEAVVAEIAPKMAQIAKLQAELDEYRKTYETLLTGLETPTKRIHWTAHPWAVGFELLGAEIRKNAERARRNIAGNIKLLRPAVEAIISDRTCQRLLGPIVETADRPCDGGAAVQFIPGSGGMRDGLRLSVSGAEDRIRGSMAELTGALRAAGFAATMVLHERSVQFQGFTARFVLTPVGGRL